MNFYKKSPAASVFITLIATFFVAYGISCAAAEPVLTYTIHPKDKLIRLSREMLVTPSAWEEVARLNHLPNANLIRPGQKIDIPLRLLKYQPAGGKLISTSGTVQVGGAPASTGTAIAEGSQVQTGPNSSAVIELGDGSQVKLLPSTLAQVMSNRNYAMRDAGASISTTWFSGLVRLAQGSLETLASKGRRRAEPLRIQTHTSTLGVRGTEFRVAMDDPAGQLSRSEVLEGVVQADNTVQKSQANLPMGTGAVINPAQKEIKVVKLLPAPDVSAMAGEVFKPQAELNWGAVPGAAGYRVQVASDAGFDKIVREYRVASTSAALTDLPSNTWYARVRGIDSQGLEGFDAVKLVALRDARLWRAANAHLVFSDGTTRLDWTGQIPATGAPLAASAYRLELASNSQFSAPVQLASTAQGQAILGPLKPGTYFVRMQATLADGKTQPSETYRFELPGDWGYTVFDLSSALQQVP